MLKINRDNKYESARYIKPGGYITKILGVKHNPEERCLAIRFDIVEGEFKGLFKEEYDKNVSNGWPNKGLQNFDYSQDLGEKALNHLITCIEESNNNYHWNGDETKLKDKLVGVVYKHATYTNQKGETKNTTSFPKFLSVKYIREGKFDIGTQAKTEKNEPKTTSTAFESFFDKVGDDDIEF